MILNGPNLNFLGKREPEIYGSETLKDVEKNCALVAAELGWTFEFHQSNHEGVLIDLIQKACDEAAAVIINPGGLTHTSVALVDALNAFGGPVMEVHISNIHRREAFRHHSYVSSRADGVIAGYGIQGYEFAMRRLAALL